MAADGAAGGDDGAPRRALLARAGEARAIARLAARSRARASAAAATRVAEVHRCAVAVSAWHVAVADRKWGARAVARRLRARAIHERRALEQWNARCARRRRAVRWEAVSERAARRLLRRAAMREWASNAKRVAQVDRRELDGAVRHARDRAIA